MKIKAILSKENITKVGYFTFFFFLVLLVREIYHFFSLPSSRDIPESISLFKYQENSIIQGYLWCLLVSFGIGLIKRNFIGWIIPQTILLIGFFFFILFVFTVEIYDISKEFVIIWILYSFFCFIIFRLFINGKPKSIFNIETHKMPYYYGLSITLSIIYWTIEYTIWQI